MNAELKKLVRNLGELAAMAEKLDSLGDLTKAEDEAKARIVALQNQAQALADEKAAIIGEAAAKAKELTDAAQASKEAANAILDDAKSKAKEIEATAMQAAQLQVMKGQDDLAVLARELEAKGNQLAALEVDIAERANALAKLENDIAKLKAKFE